MLNICYVTLAQTLSIHYYLPLTTTTYITEKYGPYGPPIGTIDVGVPDWQPGLGSYEAFGTNPTQNGGSPLLWDPGLGFRSKRIDEVYTKKPILISFMRYKHTRYCAAAAGQRQEYSHSMVPS